MTTKRVEQAVLEMTTAEPLRPAPKPDDYLSLGLTLLNLGSCGRAFGGLVKGSIMRYVGRSQAGKTFLCCYILAEAAINPAFDDYELIYDDVERGRRMDDKKFFGPAFVRRVRAPAYSKEHKPIYSRNIEEFYNRLTKKLDAGRRVVWVEDSIDCLRPVAQSKMGDGKAKINSQKLRELPERLESTGSILVLVNQSKVNMNSMFHEEITSGGRSPEYYNELDVWLRRVKSLKKTVNGVEYKVGSLIAAEVRKNRNNGTSRTVFFPFRPDYGVDDIAANVGYLCKVKHWHRSKEGNVTAPEFDFTGSEAKLARHVEDTDRQRELQVLTAKVWKGVENALSVKRKARYS